MELATILNIFILCFLVLIPWSASWLLPRPTTVSVGIFAACVLFAGMLDAVSGALVLIAGISWLIHTHEPASIGTQLGASQPYSPLDSQQYSKLDSQMDSKQDTHEEHNHVNMVEVVEDDKISLMHIRDVTLSTRPNTVVPHGELPPWHSF